MGKAGGDVDQVYNIEVQLCVNRYCEWVVGLHVFKFGKKITLTVTIPIYICKHTIFFVWPTPTILLFVWQIKDYCVCVLCFAERCAAAKAPREYIVYIGVMLKLNEAHTSHCVMYTREWVKCTYTISRSIYIYIIHTYM